MDRPIPYSKIYTLHTLLHPFFMLKNQINRTSDLVQLALKADLKPGVEYKQFHELYDIAEAYQNEFITNLTLPKDFKQAISKLDKQSEVLPTFTERSTDKSLYQQFSTPLSTAWIMIQLANIKIGDHVLEPSAGTGSISSLLKLSLATSIIVNELHPLRHYLLKEQGYQNIFSEDATQIHNMPKFRQLNPNKVIMNPPFSRSVPTKSKVDILAGAKHLLSSYKLMRQGGRLVLLINNNFNIGSKGYTLFKKYAPDHQLILNAQLDPSTFQSKGTSFETRIMVIEKSSASTEKISATSINESNIENILTLINQSNG